MQTNLVRRAMTNSATTLCRSSSKDTSLAKENELLKRFSEMKSAERWLKPLCLAVAATVVSFHASTAWAQSETAQLSVSATVESGCSLTGGSLDFGTYISGQQSDLDVNGSFGYANCGPGTLSFALDDGLQASGGNRFMTSGAAELQYEIYRNSTRTAIWGSGTDAQDLQLFSNQNGTVDVYGRVPANQAVAAGTYIDTVTITMTF